MRTNIDIDDKLMKQALKASGATTKKAVVEESLKLLVRMRKQKEALDGLWGILKEPGDWIAPPEGKNKWEEAERRYAEQVKPKRKHAA